MMSLVLFTMLLMSPFSRPQPDGVGGFLDAQEDEGSIDPGGWQQAKWGMGEEGLLRVFKGQAVRLEGVIPLPQRKFIDVGTAEIGIPELVIGQSGYRVLFLIDRKSGLYRVMIQPIQSQETHQVQFDDLLGRLVQKYGPPFRSDASDRSLISLTAQWTFPRTIIRLTYVESRTIKFRSLGLAYSLRSSEPL